MNMTMRTRFSLILLLNAAGVALFMSWFLPANHGLWSSLDLAIFHFFNQGLSADNLGYAHVVLDKTIAGGAEGCRVVIHLDGQGPTGEGREYFG